MPLWWGEFDYTVSLGQSKPNGIPNNKFCTACNLYPLEPPPKSAEKSASKRVRSDEVWFFLSVIRLSDKQISCFQLSDDVIIVEEVKKPRHDWSIIEFEVSPLRYDQSSTFHLLSEAARFAMSQNPLSSDNIDVVDHEEQLVVVVETLCDIIDHVVSDSEAATTYAAVSVIFNIWQDAKCNKFQKF